MNARFALIAAATLVSASAFAAEPTKPVTQQPSQPQSGSPQVVLASAAQVAASAAAPAPQAPTQAAPAKPHRFARVTSCRCGDAAAQPDDQQ